MSAASVAEFYHKATKYDPEALARRQHQLDWEHQPVPYKDYPDGRVIELGRYLPADARQLKDNAMQGRDRLPPEDWSMNDLSHMLYFTNGVTAIVRYPDRPFYMRAAPSAGGLYPTEIYIASKGRPGLPAGLYNYHVPSHTLVSVWDGDIWSGLQGACFDHPALADAEVAIVFTGVFHRSVWRYEDRAYRRILLDTGHVIGNLALYSPLAKLRPVPIGGFVDDALNDLLLITPTEEEALAVIALVPAASHPSGASAFPSPIIRSDSRIPEGRRLFALHEASKIPVGATPKVPSPLEAGSRTRLQFAAHESLEGPELDWKQRLSRTILERRSTRGFTGDAFSRENFATICRFAYGGLADSFDGRSLETFIAVHRIGGLDPGCYHLDPQSLALRQIRFKDLTVEVQYLCLNQDLGGDASAVIFHTADLPKAISRWGDRAYRYLHLDAGHIGERLNLAAMHLELGASGIGGFFDDQVNDLLGIPETEAVVYITTLGVPAEREGTLRGSA